MPAMPSPVRARLRGVVSACAALGLLAGGSVALADDKEPGVQERKERVDEKIDTLDSQLHDTSTQLTATYFRLRSTRSKIPGAKDALATSERARDAAAQKHDEAREELAVARERLDRSRRDLRRTSQKVKDAREDVAGYAAQMYETQGVGVDLDVALGAQTPQQAVDQMAMADTVGDVRSATVGELSTTKADLVAKEDNLSALEDEVADKEARAKKALDRATRTRDEAKAAKHRLVSLEGRQTRLAAELRRQQRSERRRLDGMQRWSDHLQGILEARAERARIRREKIAAARERREREQAAAIARARRRAPSAGSAPAPAPAPRAGGSGFLSLPMNAPVTSEFGPRYHPILHYWRLHAGRDFGGACGAPVRAAASGTVVAANGVGASGGYGNQLVIDHGVQDGVNLVTTYNHLQSFAVRSGRVSRGQLIGYEGTTGVSTGCHLHFETRENGTPVDPRDWF